MHFFVCGLVRPSPTISLCVVISSAIIVGCTCIFCAVILSAITGTMIHQLLSTITLGCFQILCNNSSCLPFELNYITSIVLSFPRKEWCKLASEQASTVYKPHFIREC
ncbi:hypothetical protein AAZX31_09G096000 [Glycine max]